MMGERNRQKQLWSYQVNLDKRVRSDHPLRRIDETLDLEFVRSVSAEDGNLLRHEHRALRGSTCSRGGDTELELALIELIDDLAHGCLIQID
jgi:hypothetical protein